MYYTIHHEYTHKPLKPGGDLDLQGAIYRLTLRKGLRLRNWYVTCWSDEKMKYQMSAEEFVDRYGDIDRYGDA